MYKYTNHARKMMRTREITEEEVESAVERVNLEFTQIDEKGRGTEYTHSIELRNSISRTIMVGWSYDGEGKLIHTVYEIKRRWKK